MENIVKNTIEALKQINSEKTSYASTKPNVPFIHSNPNLVTQKETLDFLQENSIKQFELAELQSKIADKQTKSNTRLTYLALVFAFISIVPVLREYIPIFETKNNDRDIYELKNKVLSLSNTNLENQVRILKVENELLKAKKTYEKVKNP